MCTIKVKPRKKQRYILDPENKSDEIWALQVPEAPKNLQRPLRQSNQASQER